MTRDKAAQLFEHCMSELVAISRDAEMDRDRIGALKVVAYYTHKISTEEQSEAEIARELNELKSRLSRLATQRLAKAQLSLINEDGSTQAVN